MELQVRAEIQRMTRSWRELLTAHLPDERGRCPECVGWFRRRRWPCPVWLTAHQRLVGEDAEQQGIPAPAARAHVRGRPPRDIEVIARPPAAARPGVDGGDDRIDRIELAHRIHRAAVTESRITTRSLQASARELDRPT